MFTEDLQKELNNKIDSSVKIERETANVFRILIYKQSKRYSVISYIRRQGKYKILTINDNPLLDLKGITTIPVCTLWVERLRLIKKRSKRKSNATKA